MTSTPVKKPSARKSLCLLPNILDVKPKKAKHCFVPAESKRKSMKLGSNMWTKKTKRKKAFKNQWADKA